MDDSIKDFFWVLFFLLITAVVWYKTGGPNNPGATSGPFLDRPVEKATEEFVKATPGLEKTRSQVIITPKAIIDPIDQKPVLESTHKDEISLSVGYASRQTDPQKEYIEITASRNNLNPLMITEWTVEGKNGLDIKIGKGTYLPLLGQVSIQDNIFLHPGEKAIIMTGESPIGTSFRLNQCTGYFEQFQDFIPSLPKKCPYLEDEEIPNEHGFNDSCLDYIDRLPNCKIQLTVPTTLNPICQKFIKNTLTYPSCVNLHKNDPDFYGSEWRIYLNRSEELWKSKRETIILRDETGAIIDWKSY